MSKIVKLRLGDTVKECRRVNFKVQTEDFNVYLLQDGRTMRIRLNLTDVYDVIGEKNPRGGQAVWVEHQVLVLTDDRPDVEVG